MSRVRLNVGDAVVTPPPSRRKAAVATFLGSGANTFIVAIQAVALVPLYLSNCGPRLYGAWLASGDFLVWIQAFDLGLPNLLIQRAGSAFGAGDRSTASRWFGTGIWCLGGVAVMVAVLGILVAPWIPGLFHVVGNEASTLGGCFALGAIAAGLSLFNNIFVGYSRAVQETSFLNRALVIASMFGFGVSLTALLLGAGLWSVPFGLLARSSLSLLASCWYTSQILPANLRGAWVPDRIILLEYWQNLPATAAGGIAYALMNQSETAVIGSITRPELAAVYNLTKKAIEVARSLVDVIAFATYGGFAHLVASGTGREIRKVYREIRTVRLVAAVAAASAYLVVNGSLVSRWVGSTLFGGQALTLLIALQFLASGEAFLANYLYRAAGNVGRGSWLLALEAVLRISLLSIGVWCFGISGVPLATILVCVPFAVMLGRMVERSFPADDNASVWLEKFVFCAVCVSAIGLAFWAGRIVRLAGWVSILGSGMAVFGMVLLFLTSISPVMRCLVNSHLRKLCSAAGGGDGK